MSKFLAISSAIAGASVGFIAGLAIAFLAGLHATSYVFGLAAFFCAGFSILAIISTRKICFRLKDNYQAAFRLTVFCIALGSIYTFLRVVM
jgi:hypothetical protein